MWPLKTLANDPSTSPLLSLITSQYIVTAPQFNYRWKALDTKTTRSCVQVLHAVQVRESPLHATQAKCQKFTVCREARYEARRSSYRHVNDSGMLRSDS